MPVKKDDDGRRWVEMEILLPGTPEQVWQAMATGPGMSAWFTPTIVDERVGGTVEFDFGDTSGSTGVVTAWEPPVRMVYEEHGWSGQAPPVATEIVVTSRSGDRCVVRMVHSLFTDRDDWDDELEGFESGWPGFFEVLRRYLTHFAGQPAANVRVMTTTRKEIGRVWPELAGPLGISGADVGSRCRSAPDAPQLAGVVERVHQNTQQREVMVRLEEPGPGIAVIGGYSSGDNAMLMLSAYLYGAESGALAAAAEPTWRQWLEGLTALDQTAT